MSRLCAITGSIAAGKSAVARALAARVRSAGAEAAAVDLDLVYEMLADDPKTDDAAWSRARGLAGAIAAAALAEGVAVAIIEGELWTPRERGELVARLPAGVPTTWVALEVSFDEALRRARTDPTRGISKDPAFLRAHLDAFQAALARMPATDLRFDTERTGLEEIVERLVGELDLGG